MSKGDEKLTENIIKLLEKDPGQAVKDLAKKFEVDRVFLAGYLKALENQGYVKSKRMWKGDSMVQRIRFPRKMIYKESTSIEGADPNQVVYKANLQRVGSSINESLITLAEYAKFKNWDKTKDIIISQNLLGKRSSQTLKSILAIMQKRFFTSHDILPEADILACAVSKNIPKVVKIQILYPYICKADPLIEKLLLNLVRKRTEESSTSLTKLDILQFLENEQKIHHELGKWSDYLKGRWIRGFLAFLRDFGIMEKAPSNRLLKPIIRLESFTFFLLNLLDKKMSPTEVFNNELWALYFLKNDEIERFLTDAQGRGWIYYSKAGDIIELKPKYQLGEWVNECLG